MLRTVESRGFDTGDLLAAAGLARATVEDPDARLPGASVLLLWNALRERTGDPALQLSAPTTLPFGAYRVIDYLVAASATVGEGIHRFARYFALIADAMRVTIEEEGNDRRVVLCMADGGAVPGLYVDYTFAALVGRMRMHVRRDLRVRGVDLRHAAPRDADPYVERFQAPVRFDAPTDCLRFDRAEWNAPTDNADGVLARLLDDHARMLAARLPEAPCGFDAEVRKALTTGLPEGGRTATVARALHISVRTLQRRLLASGTTFRDVSDAARRSLAESYLADHRVSIAEVAFLLGFSDQTSFNRAFRRWTGAAPGEWRRRTSGSPRGGAAALRSPTIAGPPRTPARSPRWQRTTPAPDPVV